MKKILISFTQVLFAVFMMNVVPDTSIAGHQMQADSLVGNYAYKTYRKGKAGYVNRLEISRGTGNRLHVSFELNVVPDGVYTKQARVGRVNQIVAPRPSRPRTLVQQEVCPDPQAPCNSAAKRFADYELSFRLPGKLTRGRTYTSLPFHAVLLKTFTDESCDADDHTERIERERVRIQLAYPHNKVFASYSCPNLDAVTYSFPGLMDSTGERVLIQTFIAVYAGKNEADANQFLSYVRTVYPKASLKQMTASYEILDQ